MLTIDKLVQWVTAMRCIGAVVILIIAVVVIGFLCQSCAPTIEQRTQEMLNGSCSLFSDYRNKRFVKNVIKCYGNPDSVVALQFPDSTWRVSICIDGTHYYSSINSDGTVNGSIPKLICKNILNKCR